MAAPSQTGSIDKELETAITAAVRNAGQSDSLAKRLVAWLTELSEGSTTLQKKADVRTRFENLCAAIPNRELGDED